jgi:hypothetical protein
MLKVAVKTGLICGLVLIVPVIVSIIVGVDKIFLNSIISILMLALTIWIVIRAVKEFRAESENRISFGGIFNISITAFLIASLLPVIFMYVHQNLIDPEYPYKSKEILMQITEEKLDSNPGITEDQKLVIMEKYENDDPAFNFKKVLKTMGYSMGLYLFISLILGAAIKKDLNETPDI